jgi:hypothetical protein
MSFLKGLHPKSNSLAINLSLRLIHLKCGKSGNTCINPLFPALRSSHELPQRPSPQKQFLSNQSLLAPDPSEVREERKYLYITLYFRKGEEARPFYSSTWRFSEKARSIVLFYHDPHTDRLRTHTIRDYIL